MTRAEVIRRNNISFQGDGEQVLLLSHGFGCDQNMFRFLTPAFKKQYRIILFDHVGCGKSDLDAYHFEKYENLRGYAQDIIDICEVLQLKDVIFIGHLVSAVIGVLAFNLRPYHFSKMVLICPSPKYTNENEYHGGFEAQDLEELMEVMENNYEGWASFLAPVVMKNEDKPLLVKELEESFKSIDPLITQNFARATFFSDNRNDLKKLTIPTLILQCQEDSIAPNNVGHYVHKQIKGSTLLEMKATGHCPHMTHPEETIAAIQSFLS
ncbi:alpha/beta hydrolase [Aquimarina sp. ERC-38]|uniref:alpha/beta fold hydrolase n=1 Tax=Aquimarina sp. ERC-38 TaxID=2949996 RepID=UPI002246638B|nr:alpha/beta hydrolase [Aquimarina sp. ERC-38]UZO80415.1 alpha/beta hydrolase [Aquimarina sp. ERC-38]